MYTQTPRGRDSLLCCVPCVIVPCVTAAGPCHATLLAALATVSVLDASRIPIAAPDSSSGATPEELAVLGTRSSNAATQGLEPATGAWIATLPHIQGHNTGMSAFKTNVRMKGCCRQIR